MYFKLLVYNTRIMDGIVIRKGNINDLASIQKLNQELFDNETGWHSTYIREWPYLERGTLFFTDRLNEIDGVVFIVLKNEQPIGYLCGGWLRSYTFRKEKMFSQLDNMYIKEEYRSHGIGNLLVKEFIKWSKEKGVDAIRVEAVYENTRAISFYKKHNFKEHSVMLEINIENN